MRALLSEYVGTCLLVFCAIGASAIDHLTGGASGLVGVALANGLSIAILASSTMPASGGQLNPAVTLSLWSTGQMRAAAVGPYIAAQVSGAVTGVGLAHLCFPREALVAIQMSTPHVGEGMGWQLGLGMEIATTFLLVFVIFGTAVDLRSPRLAGLYIGFAVTVAILVGGPVSGASMNPARYIGPALFGRGLDEAWLYLLGPVLGGLAAAQFYRRGLGLPANDESKD